MLDYDKKFLVKSWDNLTFDGSSIRGFTAQKESDLRLSSTGRVLLGAGRYLRRRAKCWCSAKSSTRTARRIAADMRGVLKAYSPRSCTRSTATRSTPPTRSKAFSSTAWMPSAAITRPASSTTSTPAATTTRCRATRCAPSSTRPPKCSARWASRTRRITPKSRRRNSRSTTATARSSRPPTRSSSTS